MSPQGQSHKIFICYRRRDSQGYADQVYDALSREKRFKGKVFRDIDGLEPGVDFSAAIKDALANCVVLIVLIGPLWLELLKPAEGDPPEDSVGDDGRQTANSEEDFVLLEIQIALAREIKVIPVLVGGAPPIDKRMLPEPLKRLAALEWLELSRRHRREDLRLLVRVAEKAVARASGDEGGASFRNLQNTLRGAWGWVVGPLWRRLVRALQAASFVVPTLIIPNAFIIWASAQLVASYYRRFGRIEYTITDPATSIQLALMQSAAVCVYSFIWLTAYRWLRRRREARRTKAGADTPQDTPRTETGGRV